MKVWNVVNHNYHNYISWLEPMFVLVGTPSGVSKFDFSDNFVSKNSAQIQNFKRLLSNLLANFKLQSLLNT